MATPPLHADLVALCQQMEDFEASGSVANTGTGARREGEDFEKLIAHVWNRFHATAEGGGAAAEIVSGVGSRRYVKLSYAGRAAFVPTSAHVAHDATPQEPHRWLEVVFGVSDLVQAYPGEPDAVARYAPEHGAFAAGAYPSIYRGLTTKFDDTVVLVDGGVLREKILLEYKTAKSTKGRQIDGNAHERLSFQIMQYLEVATRYTKCSMVVLANGAFVRYRNKYHVNFHVQADRLRNFEWFSMEHACTAQEFARFFDGLLMWLFEGTPRTAGGRR
ncbi:MAG: hypothetical protein FJ286_17805 [Planctomycetes bacterium]|nr:hypothetical protein [Planctomycetota bacterium]